VLFKRILKGRSVLYIVAVCSALLLSACEAKLDLEKVEAEKKATTVRFDQFQSVAQSLTHTVVVGAGGTILVSEDNGGQWQRSYVGDGSLTKHPLFIDVAACPDQRFVALDVARRIWFSDQNAQNWSAMPIATEEEVLDLTCDPSNRVWVVGSFTLITMTDDDGANWQDLSVMDDAMFTRIQFLDAQNAVIVGEFGFVYATSDGGETWEAREPVPNEFYSQSGYFRTPEEGWVVGLQGRILHTSDGGQSWQYQDTSTNAPIYNVAEIHGQVFAVGNNNTLMRLNGGQWQNFGDIQHYGYLRGITALPNGKMLVAGGGGSLHVVELN